MKVFGGFTCPSLNHISACDRLTTLLLNQTSSSSLVGKGGRAVFSVTWAFSDSTVFPSDNASVGLTFASESATTLALSSLNCNEPFVPELDLEGPFGFCETDFMKKARACSNGDIEAGAELEVGDVELGSCSGELLLGGEDKSAETAAALS